MSPALAFGIRIFLLLPLAFSGVLALAQGTTAETDRDQPRQREQWFMHGRLIPGESAAALRYRAHAQKMQLRAEQAARMNTDQNPGFHPRSARSAAEPPLYWIQSLLPRPPQSAFGR